MLTSVSMTGLKTDFVYESQNASGIESTINMAVVMNASLKDNIMGLHSIMLKHYFIGFDHSNYLIPQLKVKLTNRICSDDRFNVTNIRF